MYNLPYFKEGDQEVVLEFMRKHPFIFLTGVNEKNKPVATQVPVFIDEKDGKLFLTGHIMRNNDHHKAFEKNPNVLAVFTSPHVYVSATWYDDPHQASTWNYMSVHAKGELKFQDGQALINILKRTTDYYENNPHSGSNFDDLPQEYVERLSKAIVAFEIEVHAMDHVFKLSQNRDEKSYDNIVGKLAQGDADAREISNIMKEHKGKVYNE
jgi:transcriptional regulator